MQRQIPLSSKTASIHRDALHIAGLYMQELCGNKDFLHYDAIFLSERMLPADLFVSLDDLPAAPRSLLIKACNAYRKGSPLPLKEMRILMTKQQQFFSQSLMNLLTLVE